MIQAWASWTMLGKDTTAHSLLMDKQDQENHIPWWDMAPTKVGLEIPNWMIDENQENQL